MKYYYPQDLPVTASKQEIKEAIQKNQVVIIAGDTGSGKTTQIPKICLEILQKSSLLIGCTQPRRVAASSVASRVSEELEPYGDLVGYTIRFHDYTTPKTRIKFMTDGVLLAETRNDPYLRRYGVIIVDEAHERSLNIDFLLGYLKRIQSKRPDLKIILSSATIDTESFSKHFNKAPVIQVSGRTYPVDVSYKPLDGIDEESAEHTYVEYSAQVIGDIVTKEKPGDILAFLPTEKDIRSCCSLLEKALSDVVVLPMYGRLPGAEQRKIFKSYPKTKIVVATNVAETSITVPGIRYVVDCGLARISHYNSRAKTTSLPIRKISQASCDQRKGRCGRIGPGKCIRLYSNEDYLTRDEHTLPEIKRANLADVILQMISLKLGRPDNFPFIDPPHRNTINDGYRLLFELGAIDSSDKLTSKGKLMAKLPIDPCISRVLLEAKEENCLQEVTVIASALAIQDPRVRPPGKEKEVDAVHRKFAHPHSDFMALLTLWKDFHLDQGATRSWSKLKKYCKKNFLSFQRMREWLDLHEQLNRVLSRLTGFTVNSTEGSYNQIHKSIGAGFLRNIAVKKQKNIYQGAGNRELMIFPGSHQFLKGGEWIMAASFMETNRLYGLTVATIDPEWIEPLASHLIRYSWSSPRWSKKNGQVIANEKVSLFGLTLVESRVVNFPKQNSRNIPAARDIFIQEALITNNLHGTYSFLAHNHNLIEKWRKTEDKLRTTAVVQPEEVLTQFYDDRLPDHVCDRTTLNRYLKRKGHKHLFMNDDDVVLNRPDDSLLSDYPQELLLGTHTIKLEYNFTPGNDNDGVTFLIPVNIAPILSPAYFDWIVPGLLKEKITFLLKGLPKSVRKKLVPINLTTERLLDEISLYQGSLLNGLEAGILKFFRLSVHRSDWPDKLPLHLTPRFNIFDLEGKTVASGRELQSLVTETEHNQLADDFSAKITPGKQRQLQRFQELKTREWDFEGLPEMIPLLTSQNDIAGYHYPVLIGSKDTGSVSVEFFTNKLKAIQQNFKGVELLYRLQLSQEYKSLKKYCSSLLTAPSALVFLHKDLDKKGLLEQMLSYIFRTLFPSINGTIPSREQYEQQLASVKKQGFYKTGRLIGDEIIQLLRKRKDSLEKLNHFTKLDSRRLLFTKAKETYFMACISRILPTDFLKENSELQLQDCYRQFQSLDIRLERFYSNPMKDATKQKLVEPHLDKLIKWQEKSKEFDEDGLALLNQYNTMVNEYIIAVYSPELKARMAVSQKKLTQLQQRIMTKC